MTLKTVLTSLIVTSGLMSGQAALAQQAGTTNARPVATMACGPHAAVVAKLKGSFEEQMVSLGLTANGQVMQIFATETGDTWTLLSTSPQGISCILASGKHWQGVIVKADGPAA